MKLNELIKDKKISVDDLRKFFIQEIDKYDDELNKLTETESFIDFLKILPKYEDFKNIFIAMIKDMDNLELENEN
jgi:hypothetical protein